ncbi:MAG: DUF2294 domain-containing protein [Zhaonellaceae bacterium]|nr:DUF2294 domain-containing protein [Clostridia bacterium]
MKSAFSYDKNKNPQRKLSEHEVKQLQHEINIFVQKYCKETVGKGSDYIKSSIYDDMFIIRGEGFLTEAEKYIAQTPAGSEMVRASRHEGLLRFLHVYNSYLEEKFGAKVLHNIFDTEPDKDFWMHTVVFDRKIV